MEFSGEKSTSREEEFRAICTDMLGDAEFDVNPDSGYQERRVHHDIGDGVAGFLTTPGFSVAETLRPEGPVLTVYYHQIVPYPEEEVEYGGKDYYELEHLVELDAANQVYEHYENTSGREDTKLDFLDLIKLLKAGAEQYAKVVEERRALVRQAERPAFGQLEMLEPEAGAEIFERTDVEALARRTGNPNLDYSLLNYIKTFELEPVASQQLTDTLTAHYSKVFKSNGRLAALAYMEQGGTVMPRYIYLSNTQGVWRYLPHSWNGTYAAEMRNLRHGVNLPVPMQAALAQLAESGDKPAEVEGHLYLTAAPQGYNAAFDHTFHDELGLIDPEDHFREWQRRPEELDIKPELQNSRPDFAQTVAEWQLDSPMYGSLDYKVVPSADGRLHYVFAKDQEGRAWLAAIDDTAANIRSNGLRQSVIIAGYLTQPATDKLFGGKESMSGKNIGKRHFDMYERFVRKTPLVREFLNIPAPKTVEELAAELRETDIMVDEKAGETIDSYVKRFIERYTAYELMNSLEGFEGTEVPDSDSDETAHEEPRYRVDGNLVNHTYGGSLVDMFVGMPNGQVEDEEAMIGPIDVRTGRAVVTFYGRDGVYGYVHVPGSDEIRYKALTGDFSGDDYGKGMKALILRLSEDLKAPAANS